MKDYKAIYVYAILQEQFTTCSRQFIKTVLLEFINVLKYTIILYHTMTVLLELSIV